jgi:diguanylate cyclase (GGDEF)-like protein
MPSLNVLAFLHILSFLIRLIATIWGIRLVWRMRDWRLSFLPIMLGLLTIEPLLSSLGERESQILQVSVLTVAVAMILHFVSRQQNEARGQTFLRILLGAIIVYQMFYLGTGAAWIGSALSHADFSLSMVLCLNVVLLSRILYERQRIEDQLRTKALHDALTGLPNRLLFKQKLQEALARIKHDKNYHFAVLFIDLDRFKLLNDTLGHTAGDLFLVETGRRLTASVRPGDTVARLGGDEFAVLLENVGQPSQAQQVADRLLEQLSVPQALGDQEIFTSASIGIALSSAMTYAQQEDLLRDADTAMYRAKATGPGRHEVFSAEMHESVKSRLELEADLQHALVRNQLVVYYQPVVTLDTGRLWGCEALLRWNHPTRGLVGPAEFIPIAEETGLITQFGAWVLETAAKQTRAWQLEGHPHLIISVNVSPRQVIDGGFPETVSRALANSGLSAQSLQLELTESMIMESSQRVQEELRGVANLGVQFAVDDFGTGYSSISYLRRFPIRALKIDRSFVKGLDDGESVTHEVVTAMIKLGQTLRLEVTVEGVETEEQLAFLASHGCVAAQGFVFSPALPAEVFANLLDQRWGWKRGAEPVSIAARPPSHQSRH